MPGGTEQPRKQLDRNKLSLGLFGVNCSGGLAVTTVPERWDASWENNQKLARMADDAGLEADDVILEVDGEAVGTPGELVAAIRSLDPGDEVTITYERDGEEDSVDVTLTERDDSSANLRPS